MEIKAYSFEQNSHTFAQVKRTVAECVKEQVIYFESYSDPKALFTNLSECIDNTDVVLIGVESKVYLKFKPILIKAFNFTPAYSDDIAKAIGDAVTDEKLKKAHSLVPNESKELISRDGLYSGFYIKDDEQYIVVFPLADTVVPYILQNSSLPFFGKAENKPEVFEDITSHSAASEKATQIAQKLQSNNIRLAIPSTPAARMLKDDIKKCDGYGEYVFFTPFVNDTGIEDPKQYAAQLAKSAMELRSTQLGATLSNIFREKKGEEVINYYSFISVATADKVIVKKLYADASESIDNLIVEATNELYSMIDKYIDETIFKMNATEEEIAKYEQSLIEAEVVADITPEKKKGKKGTVIAIAVLIAAIALCVACWLYFGGYFVNPSDAPIADNLQNNGNFAGQSTDVATQQPLNSAGNTFAELTESPSETSIFNVTTTLPTIEPNTNYNIIYTPANNRTTAPETTKKQEKTTASSTTTPPSTTQKATESSNDDEEIIF